MRKGKRGNGNGLRQEYDFASMPGGVRGKYAGRLKKGSNIVLLEPDVAAAFPSAAAVNEALRALLSATQVVRRTPARPNKPTQRTITGRR